MAWIKASMLLFTSFSVLEIRAAGRDDLTMGGNVLEAATNCKSARKAVVCFGDAPGYNPESKDYTLV